MKTLPLYFILLSFSTFAGNWTPVGDPSLQVWKHRSTQALFLQKQQVENDNSESLTDFSPEHFLAERQELLELLGLSQITITHTQTTDSVLENRGSYLNSDQQKIYFREFHQFTPKKIHQILLTSESAASLDAYDFSQISKDLPR